MGRPRVTPTPPAWLVVPVTLDALVVPTAADAVNLSPDYLALVTQGMRVGTQIEATLFQTITGALEVGTHLHWSLPDALTHGSYDNQTHEMRFPKVPNRWLVARRWDDAHGTNQARAWVVQSDAIIADGTADPDQVVWPRYPMAPGGLTPTGVEAVCIGKVFECEDWTGGDPDTVSLEAVGPGDPTFAAVYQSCRNIFGFRDPMDDLPTAATVAWMVFGWYATAADDPFSGVVTKADLDAILSAFRWGTVEPLPVVPTVTYYHGAVVGVPWNPGTPFASGVPDGTPQIAIGNNEAEAAAAIVAQACGRPEDAGILEAMHAQLLDLVDGPSGTAATAEELFQRRFTPSPRGTVWDVGIVPPGAGAAPANDNGNVPYPPAIGAALLALNEAQATLESSTADLASKQFAAYSTWCYCPYLDQSDPATAAAARAYITGTMLPDLTSAHAAQAQAQAGVATAHARLQAAIGVLAQTRSPSGPAWEIRSRTATPDQEPTNPVLVFAGPGIERSFKHGADGILDPDGLLRVRGPGQVIHALRAAPAGGAQPVNVTAADLETGGGLAPLPACGPIPAEAALLFGELALLDQAQAYRIAQAASAARGGRGAARTTLEGLADRVRIQQGLPHNAALAAGVGGPALDAQALGAHAGFAGVWPDAQAVTPWTQPWNPIRLMWRVQWTPAGAVPEQVLDGWQLGDYDYTWPGPLPPLVSPIMYEGCVPLNLGTAPTLAASLTQWVDAYEGTLDAGTASGLRTLAQQVGALQMVSQALSGFNQQLCQTAEALQVPILDPELPTLSTQVGDATSITPAIGFATDFSPLRGGFIQVWDIWIVDSFGQHKPLITGGTPACIRAACMIAPQARDDPRAMLPPRIVQPSRLAFDWISAGVTSVLYSDADPARTPVAGWLVPNHIDHSLMIYDATGNALGELETIDGALGGGGAGVRWVTPPGRSAAFGAPPDIANPYLRDFVRAMLDEGIAQQNALAALLSVIDETTWQTEPIGAWQDQGLAVLIGRPLALVRAAMRIELNGAPRYEQSMDALKKLIYPPHQFETESFEQLVVPTWLGDAPDAMATDGLVGFFTGDRFSQFQLSRPGVAIPTSTYVVPAQPVKLSPADAGPTLVTMLVDPRAPVRLRAGVLPVPSLALDAAFVNNAWKAMDITFAIGPVLTEALSVSTAPGADDILPLLVPAQRTGTWSWIEHPSPTAWKAIRAFRSPATTADMNSTPIVMRSGWLKLSSAFGRDTLSGSSNPNVRTDA